ncbi:MAG: aldehyde ferredoxin oxidoreductase C-terminal domain-containing protein [Bacillota bacterium]
MTIIRVHMGKKSINMEQSPQLYKMLGARGLTSTIIADEVDPGCEPLGPENKIVFAPGLLGGTIVPCSSRTSVGTKSPLTGGIKESSSGGPGGTDLGRLGVKALIIEGLPMDNQWYYLRISADGTQLLSASELLGLGCYDTCKKLQKIHGNKCSIFVIGQAGERKMLAANIAATDKEGKPTRQFGRGGVGAVLGSKHIKAVIIDATTAGFIKPGNKSKVANECKKFANSLVENPVSGNALPRFGTAVLVNMINSIGALPTRNFSSGVFEGAQFISGETMTEIQQKRGGKVGHACSPGCVIRCSNIYVDEDGKEITGGFEYETVCLLGSNIGIRNLDEIAYLNRMCDDYGVDTIEIGAALGIAMEAGELQFGRFDDAKQALGSIAKNDLLGKVLGQGAQVTGKVFGATRIPTVKGQAMAAYDPRGIKGMGAIYATSPMGADHTAGPSCTTFIKAKPEEQLSLAKEFQFKATAMENTGLCRFCCYALFTDPKALQSVMNILNNYYDISIDEKEFWSWGKKILQIEKRFNEKAGFCQQDDRIPEFMNKEKLLPSGQIFDISNDALDTILDF